MHLDPREKPPECSKALFKKLQKLSEGDLASDSSLIDLTEGATNDQGGLFCEHGSLDRQIWEQALNEYLELDAGFPAVRDDPMCFETLTHGATPMRYTHDDFPGEDNSDLLLLLHLTKLRSCRDTKASVVTSAEDYAGSLAPS